MEVHAISSPGPWLEDFGRQEGIPVHGIPMRRAISPCADLTALCRLIRFFHRIRPTIVHAHTPKAGLLAMMAAWISWVPIRIYHVHGLPCLTARGWKRHLIQWGERLTCRLAHRVCCVSHSLRQVVIGLRICPARKSLVFHHGSINGVDAERTYHPLQFGPELREQVRTQCHVPGNALVLGFVGRLVVDKGVAELAEAWGELRDRFPNLHWIVVGATEEHDRLPAKLNTILTSDPRIHLVGFQWDPSPYYAIMDVLALPTYREGFGLVAIEAAAMGIPVVASRVEGCLDSVQDDTTGTLVPVQDVPALTQAVSRYLSDTHLRKQHGDAGRKRVRRRFRREDIWNATLAEYLVWIDRRGFDREPRGPNDGSRGAIGRKIGSVARTGRGASPVGG